MRKRKMCIWYSANGINSCDCAGSRPERGYVYEKRYPCPSDTNKFCEIVKPKARYKRVRAWGHRIHNLDGTTGWEFYRQRRFVGIKHIVEVPIVITISAKNWEKIR